MGDGHDGLCTTSVLVRVRQRLLDDPVGGDVQPGRQLERFALGAQGHRQPGGARAIHQLVQATEPRRAVQVLALAVVDRPEQPPQLGQSVPPGGADQVGRPGGGVGVAFDHPARTLGLDDHHAELVGQHVVQLSRHPNALRGHGVSLGRVGQVGRQLRLLCQLAGKQRVVAQDAPAHERTQAEDHHREGHVAGGLDQARGQDRHHHQRQRSLRTPPDRVRARRVAQDHQRERGERDVERHGQERQQQHPGQAADRGGLQHVLAPGHQRQRDQGDQQQVEPHRALDVGRGQRDRDRTGRDQNRDRDVDGPPVALRQAAQAPGHDRASSGSRALIRKPLSSSSRPARSVPPYRPTRSRSALRLSSAGRPPPRPSSRTATSTSTSRSP